MMPDRLPPSCGPERTQQAGGSYLKNVAFPAWISMFGPRPNFHISSARQDKEWLEWVDGGRHHGLAAFAIDAEGLVSKEPIKTIPRKRPGHVSARQWGDRMAAIFDGAEIRRNWQVYREPGEVAEVRILNAGKWLGTVSGYFDNEDSFTKIVSELASDPDHPVPAIYFTINPVSPDLLARAANRTIAKAKNTTSDADIVALHWLPGDLDSKRPAGISSTDEEHDAAIAKAYEVRGRLIELGWPENAFVLADSGNGAHLDTKIDLQNVPEDVALVRRCLEAMDFLFSDEAIHVDTTSQNPARIWKVRGTMARKGDSIQERPHRLSRFLEVPETMETVTRKQLEALAAMLPEPEKISQPSQKTGGLAFDPVEYCQAHNLSVHHSKTWADPSGTKCTVAVLEQCIFNPDHHLSAVIIGWPNGARSYRCRHNSCLGKKWKDAKAIIEPEAAKHPRDSPEPKRATARTTVQEGMREQAQTDFEHLTEGGNAHRLERIHGDDMRFNHTHKKWNVWDGGRWKVDGDGNAARLAEDVVSMLYIAAANATDSKMRDKIAVFAKSTDSRKGINNMLALAANRRMFALTADDFDQDPWLLGAGEVTIDLKTGEAIEPRRSDLISLKAGARYDSFADCSLWENFLKDIFAGNEDLINYIKRAVGYCLTGSTSEQIFFFCHGTGANGKSVFLAVLRAMLGEYAKQADFSTFLVQRNEKVRNDLAALAGARVITAVEAEEGGRLSMQVLKSWTGGDPITARFLFGENFTFKPQGKIWLAANTKPIISERNYAAWRRVHLIPFNVTIPPEKRDQNLENKLIAELPGIFNWALEGLKDYLKVGLKTPEAVAKATAEYRKENDSLESFIAECCETGKLKVCKNSELYPNYVNFCNMSGLSPLSQTKFSPEMSSKPGISSKKSKFGVEWKGLDLKADWKPQKNEPNPSPASGGPKGDDLDPNAELSLVLPLREGLCAFESNLSPNQSTDSGDGLSQPVTQDKTEPSKGSVVGGQKEGDEGDSVNILKVGFRTDYRTDWNGKMHDSNVANVANVANVEEIHPDDKGGKKKTMATLATMDTLATLAAKELDGGKTAIKKPTNDDPCFQRFKAGMKKRTCCLCGRSFPYDLTPYFNKGQSGYICATCHMEGPPSEIETADSQTKLEAKSVDIVEATSAKPLRVIYKPKGAALEYSGYGLNLYNGCSHKCSYCYNKPRFNDRYPCDQPRKAASLEAIEADLRALGDDKTPVHLSFVGDPYDLGRQDNSYVRKVLHLFKKYDHPFQVLSKGGTKAVQDFDLYGEGCRFGATLTFINDADSLKWEPGAALPADRIEALRIAHERGIMTWASLEPVIDPAQTLRLIELTHDFVDDYGVGKLNHSKVSIDWGKFRTDAEILLTKCGSRYMIKRALLDATKKTAEAEA